MRALSSVLSLCGFVLASCSGGKDGTAPIPTDAGGTDTDTGADTSTDTGGLTLPPSPNEFTSGGAERCLLLHGGSDRVVGNDVGLPFDDEARTLQAWIRTNYDGQQVAAAYGRGSAGQGYVIGVTDGRAFVGLAGTDKIIGSTFVSDDAWHHIAGAWDGTTAAIVVDGASDGGGQLSGSTLAGNTTVGNYAEGSNQHDPWIGWVDDVKIFHGARPPHEVAADLDGLNIADDLLLWYDFEVSGDPSGNGVTVEDLSGNGNDGLTVGQNEHPSFPACR